MTTPWFASLLRCPLCHHAAAWRDGEPVCAGCSKKFDVFGESILVPTDASSADWAEMQGESVERYEADDYNRDTIIPRLFGGFVAATLRRDDVVLDVGCGIAPELPAYVNELGLTHYLGLEPLSVRVERRYPCLVGAIAEQTPLQDCTVDALLYATSLDHIEDVTKALREARRILKPGGRAYFWVGLNEPEVVAREMAPLHSWIYKGSMARRIASLLAPHVVLGRSLVQLGVRSYRMSRGIPLDHAHFRYYTRASLGEELGNAGFHITRDLLVPGSSSIFLECATAGAEHDLTPTNEH